MACLWNRPYRWHQHEAEHTQQRTCNNNRTCACHKFVTQSWNWNMFTELLSCHARFQQLVNIQVRKAPKNLGSYEEMVPKVLAINCDTGSTSEWRFLVNKTFGDAGGLQDPP